MTKGVKYMLKTSSELAAIKDDVSKSKAGIIHLKEKIAQNTKAAIKLLQRKKALESVRKVVTQGILMYK